MKNIAVLFVFIFMIAGATQAQRLLPDSLKSKYHMLTWEEFENPVIDQRDITPTDAPDGPVRNIAEWERNQGVIVAYPYGGFGIPAALIQMLAEDVHVYVIYDQASALSSIQSELNGASVNMNNVSFHNIPVDSYWTRDFSPWFIVHGEDNQIGMVNFDYNRPSRPNDNNVPVEFGSILNLPVYGMNVEHTGGNYMCDGMGKAASTDLIYEENSISDALVDQRMEDYLGITDNIVVADPMDDYIKHIDCWGKYLDVDKIIIGEVPESDYRYDDYEAAADYFANHPSSYGNNYEVYRVYSPDGQPYTNSLIMNGKVYIPVPASGSSSNWNDEAVASYQEAMPGYEIITVTNTISTATEWQSTDALHCRTHEVPDVEMLHIYHSAINGLQEPSDNFTISADILSYGGNALIADSLNLYYRVNDGNWQSVNMSLESGDTYSADIPSQNGGDVIEYIIRASDESGRTESHPYIGFPDPHEFIIDGASAVQTQESIVSVFPNPVRGSLNIAMHFLNEDNASLEIIDVNGRVCYSESLSDTGDYQLVRFDVSDLPNGAYVVKISSSSKVLVEKFIKR